MTSVNRVRLGNRGRPRPAGTQGPPGWALSHSSGELLWGGFARYVWVRLHGLWGCLGFRCLGGGGGVGMGCWGVGSGQEGGFVFRVIFAPGVSLFFGVLVGYLNLGWLMLSFFVFFFFSCVGAEPPPGGDNAVGGVLAGVFAKSGKVCFFFLCEHLGPASGENAVGLSFKKRKVHFN